MSQPDSSSMDWRQIQSAIMGTSFSTEKQANGKEGWDSLGAANSGVSSPASLRAAAARFAELQASLAQLGEQLRGQQSSLTGSGQWTGQGANSFDQLVRTFDRTIKAHSEPLTGARSYSDLLYRAADGLEQAITRLQQINYEGALKTKAHYETLLKQWGNSPLALHTSQPARPWFTTSNGTVVYTPSAYPEIDQWMTAQARTVMTTLSGTYRVVTSDMRTPGGSGPGALGAMPELPPPPDLTAPDLTVPGMGSPGAALPGMESGMPDTSALGASAAGASGGSLPQAPEVPTPAGLTDGAGLGAAGLGAGLAAAGLGAAGLGAAAGLGTGGRSSVPLAPPVPRPVGVPTTPAIASRFPFAGGGPLGSGPLGGGASGPLISAASHAPLTPGGRPPATTALSGPNGMGSGYGGMPMMPMMPMGGAGGGGGQGGERERTTWLQEDRGIWDTTGEAAPRVITGPVEIAWDDATEAAPAGAGDTGTMWPAAHDFPYRPGHQPTSSSTPHHHATG